ncbi:MAG: proteasome-activating nucleotidase [Candidatus Lokiarchaeota archaeon]|nr:proteasome-activating nucleotidase [Candidatus Lokiarchaeota archaeon]
MESTPIDDEKQKDIKDENYLATYIRHLEKRLRILEVDKKTLDQERINLQKELDELKIEFNQLRAPPLITGVITDILDENNERVVISTYSGQSYVVITSKSLRRENLFPGLNVALNQHNYSVMELLPTSKDPFIKGMELLDSIPDITYEDIGGLDFEINEVREAVELPLTKPQLFEKVGIEPPKGVLLQGPPGTGKTLIAKAVANKTQSTFIRVVGSELINKFIGEGARFIREIFELAREKAPTIIFIDELDAIGAERSEDATSGDREVQRTLMQLLSELDGFDNRGNVRFIAATNRADILDQALLRPGRFDRIVEIPIPNEKAREDIFKVHMKNLRCEDSINVKKLVEMTGGFSGADIKAVCNEAGMFAIRKDATIILEQDFLDAIDKILKSRTSPSDIVNIYS